MSDTSRPPLTFSFFPPVPSFLLESNDVADGETLKNSQVANGMGYTGENLSPQLSWSGFPQETKSFTLTCHDPDAPTGSGFWHWLVVNIPLSVTTLDTNAGLPDGGLLPAGAFHVANDAGAKGFLGAAPPAGEPEHRYVFTVHAIDVEALELTENASAAYVGFNTRFHGIARAQIVPIFAP